MALAIIAGCGKTDPESTGPDTPDVPPSPPVENKTLAEQIPGEWHCTPVNIEADIYVSFTEDGKFELYQQITEGAYRLYRGTWHADEETETISGKYNDGEAWGSSYTVDMRDDSNTMTFTDSALIKYVYSRQEIPASVKDNCAVEVKSPYAD